MAAVPPRLTRRRALGPLAGALLAALAGCAAATPPAPTRTVPTSLAVTPAHPASAAGAPRIGAPATLEPPPSALASPTDPAPTDTPAAPATELPTPTAVLHIDGPPHDPGPLTWAHPGPYLGAGYQDARVTSFGARQRLVTTYYFYWWDLTSLTAQARSRRSWAQQPPDPAHYSFLSPDTHRQQFEDMQAAGIDFALPVYWGEPGHPGRAWNPTPGHFWSTEGIPPMVQALDQLAAAGRPFKVGMFYDTTIMANADLTTPDGQDYFYVNVRDFFSRFPPQHWAAIGGKPVIWLYDTQWVSRFDQSSLDYLSEHFAQDFGGRRPFLVREWQWYRAKAVPTPAILHSDLLYAWGAAPSGFNPDPRFGVAEVGPGFSNTRYCHNGAAGNCFDVSRESGAYYTGQLQAALRSKRQILAAETWNEFSEGSDIAETVQYGRQYIDLTRTYADAFHAAVTSL
jgi:hypothetical protein